MRSVAFAICVLTLVASSVGQRNPPRGGPPQANDDPAAVNLIRMCEYSASTRPSEYAMCAGWMAGLMLAIDASESLKDTRSICFPVTSVSTTPSVQQEELRRIFSKYVTAHPDKLNVHVGHVAYQAFLEAFPCKKPN